MAETQTLNSRLRLLVAKSYRAERLYSSLRSPELAKRGGGVSDIANDARAREWQRSYYELRSVLNDILSQTPVSRIAAAVIALRQKFLQRLEEDRRSIQHGVEALHEIGQREEFAHMLKLTLELVKCKARAQAAKAVADELTAVLLAVGVPEHNVVSPSSAIEEEPMAFAPNVAAQSGKGNVVELRRRSNG